MGLRCVLERSESDVGRLNSDGSEVCPGEQQIWKKKDSEVVIAVIESPDKTDQFILRQREFNSLAPQKWLVGEIECTKCRRWYHPTYVAMSDEDWDKEKEAYKVAMSCK
ncbi:hypothetical protein PAMP_012785 [Pampus punctatissimus]